MPRDRRVQETKDPSFSGSSRYLDVRPGSREAQPRIYVRFLPDGEEIPHLALLDTGAHYCILNRDLGSRIGARLTAPIGRIELRTAQGLLEGDLYTHRITMLADIGESLDIEATLLISPDWLGPSFLGYLGALDRLRFAIDPQSSRFYFSALS